jgi:hypothetical protein
VLLSHFAVHTQYTWAADLPAHIISCRKETGWIDSCSFYQVFSIFLCLHTFFFLSPKIFLFLRLCLEVLPRVLLTL